MVVFPPCKINLGLNIIRKRPDNYHDLETCFFPVAYTDVLEIIQANTFAFTSSGLAIAGDSSQNLCVKAYELLKGHYALPPVAIHLHKIIPMGAGLGGGSANGAYVLRLLNTMFNLGCTPAQLASLAAALGSDCAFFTQDQPMLGTGRGEILAPISVGLGGMHMVIVKPDVHVSTAEAYAGIAPRQAVVSVREVIENYGVDEWRSLLVNDFEASVFHRHPVIAHVKETLYTMGAVYASMSGSGAAVFGIFSKPVDTANRFGNATVWTGVIPV